MNYSDDSSSCRVAFFKPSGKWYCDEAVEWLTYKSTPDGLLIHDAFREALTAHFARTGPPSRLNGMTAICLDPYHEHSHPISLVVGS